ncbi:MAG TPA: rRNA maturation RNase YbeY [Burkholderiales bacterium]
MQRAVRGAPAARRLRAWALAAAPAGSDVTLRVAGAAESRRLNRAYRGRDYATNVLSFAYAPARSTVRSARFAPVRGDIVLCHPVIRREARAQRKALAAHYAHLVVHGMLHLRGMDHARARDAAGMERAEIRVLRRLGFADPYAVK